MVRGGKRNTEGHEAACPKKPLPSFSEEHPASCYWSSAGPAVTLCQLLATFQNPFITRTHQLLFNLIFFSDKENESLVFLTWKVQIIQYTWIVKIIICTRSPREFLKGQRNNLMMLMGWALQLPLVSSRSCATVHISDNNYFRLVEKGKAKKKKMTGDLTDETLTLSTYFS